MTQIGEGQADIDVVPLEWGGLLEVDDLHDVLVDFCASEIQSPPFRFPLSYREWEFSALFGQLICGIIPM